MPVNLEDIAKAAGVSLATVSRSLTPGAHSVSEETRQRVLSVAQELGYRPNLAARGLRTERTYMVGIIVDSVDSPFSPTIIRGIQDHLQEQQYSSIIINADWNAETEIRAIDQLISRSIDGVIFVESRLRGSNEALDVADKPYVFVARLISHGEPNSVVVDDRYGACLAIDHLAGLGHSRIGFIAGPAGWDASGNRLLGYQQALARWGYPFEPELVREGNWEAESGTLAASKLLRLPQPPSAIFAANDLMALGAIYAIQDAGLRVPQDIAVVGYDDREIAHLARPAITTVAMPVYEMGQASARLLLALLDKPSRPPESLALHGRLIVRASSGAAHEAAPPENSQSYRRSRRLRPTDMPEQS